MNAAWCFILTRLHHHTNFSRRMWFNNILLVLFFLHKLFSAAEEKRSPQFSFYRSAVQSFNDPQFPNQYYLAKDLMNIHKTWETGINGTGVTICVNDPKGVDYNHPDLRTKFDFQASYNFGTNTSEPTPNSGYFESDEAHGTMMAGLAAAKANNANCGVGVAFSARISGIRNEVKGWDINKAFAKSLEYRNDINDIFSNSWGFILPLQINIAYMHPLIKAAVRRSAEQGRQGKGNIIVFAAGNGGMLGGTCTYDEYISSIYTIGISVITYKNKMSLQNVKCPGVMAVTYGRDGMAGINDLNAQLPSPGLNNKCSKTASSSSASAAIASGIFALVLQANPNLTWRDVQHLVARSSSANFDSVTWKVNGAGLKVNDGFGFGVMDAKVLTDNAKIWKNVGTQLNCTIPYIENTEIDGIAALRRTINVSRVPSCNRIRYLEHVVLVVKLNFTLRRNIEVALTSPAGTKSVMLRPGRSLDRGKEVDNLSLMSLHNWGENPSGNWNLEVQNVKRDAKQKGFLFRFSLQLFGTYSNPMLGNKGIGSSQIGANSSIPKPTSTKPQTKMASKITINLSSKQYPTYAPSTVLMGNSMDKLAVPTQVAKRNQNNQYKGRQNSMVTIITTVVVALGVVLGVALFSIYRSRRKLTPKESTEEITHEDPVV